MAYDLVQSVFLMNMAANGVSSYADTESNLQTYLSHYLSGGEDPLKGHFQGFFPLMNLSTTHPGTLIGRDWSVVWGPGVIKNPKLLYGNAVNAMYVAYSPSLNTYVVAIAATNPESAYDWMVEDADVEAQFMPAWPPTLPFVKTEIKPAIGNSRPAISAATALGLSNLLTPPGMKDSKTGKSLPEFLQGFPSDHTATIIFSGHSLAGALAPTLALYLLNVKAVLGHFNKVLVLPTAGATPGNSAFADLWKDAFPPKATGSTTKINNWNTDIASNRDIVPHAWNNLDNWVKYDSANGQYTCAAWGTMDLELGVTVYELKQKAIGQAEGGYYGNLTQELLDPSWQTYQWTFDTASNQWQYLPKLVNLIEYTSTNPMKTSKQLDDVIMASHVEQYYGLFNVVPGPRMALSIPNESVDG